MTVNDEAPGGAVSAPRRNRWAIILGVVLALALLGASAWWLTRAEPGQTASVAIELEPSKIILGQDGSGGVSLTVKNTSGHRLTDATVRLTLADPGGDFPKMKFSDVMFDPECGIEEPGPHPDCVSAEKRAKRQSCAPEATAVVCDGDLAEGTEKYAFSYSIGSYPDYEELAALADYPDLKMSARVLVGGESVETATQKLSVDMPEGYGRVRIDDLPRDLAMTDPPSRRHDWSVTIINDTQADVSDASVTLEFRNYLTEIDSAHDGCAHNTKKLTPEADIICEHVDIPAGETITIAARVNVAADAVDSFAESCPPTSPTIDDCRAKAAELRMFVEADAEGYHGFAEESVILDYED